MQGFLTWIITFVVMSILLIWSALNTHWIAFDPSPVHSPVRLPVFVLIMAGAVLGFMWGSVMTWLAATPDRRKIRALKQETVTLKKEADQNAAHAARANPDAVIAGLLPEHSSPSSGSSSRTITPRRRWIFK